MIAAFGRAIESLGGRYVTAEDVGISTDDMVAVRKETSFVSGLPVAEGQVGGDPGPYTAMGIYLGVKAAAKRAFGTSDMSQRHVAIQGIGSVGGGLARLLAEEGAKLTLADVSAGRAKGVGGRAGRPLRCGCRHLVSRG